MLKIKDFTNIEYLKSGNDRQKKAYEVLSCLQIFERLKSFYPVLTGTVPLDIDLPGSDLDIICYCKNHKEFSSLILNLFGETNNFEIKTFYLNKRQTTIARFDTGGFKIEIFGQNIPVKKQNAYRHLITEYIILQNKGEHFKREIRKLKSKGLKTEPAFANLLGLKGNPYKELLNFNENLLSEK